MFRERAVALVAWVATVASCTSAPTPTPAPVEKDFVDGFAASGITLEHTGSWPFLRMGPVNAAAVGDCDGDHLPDAYVVTWDGPGIVWRNTGGARFRRVGPLPGMEHTVASAAAMADLDNDGRLDLLVAVSVEDFIRAQQTQGGHGPAEPALRAFRNTGSCAFEEVSAAWGLGTFHTDDAAMFAGVDLSDVNLDGRLDMITRHSVGGESHVRMYLSQPDGTWAESMNDLIGGPVVGSNWTNFFHDVDDDGLTDLFVLFDEYQGPPARFFHRVSATAAHPYVEETFDPRIFGPEYNPAGLMGGASGDVDGDGFLDLYLVDLGPQHLYLHRSGRVDQAERAGVQIPRLPVSETPTVAFGASLCDYDNDTWPDLAVAVGVTDGYYEPPSAFLFHNRGDGTFDDVTPILHQTGSFSSLWMTAADLDRDGRMDYWMGGLRAPPHIYLNRVPSGRSLAVRLRGRTSNSEGVGAMVRARLGARTLVQEMQSGGSPWGYGEHRLLFGLGAADRVDAIEVRWPSGFVQRTGPVRAGTETVIEEPDLLRVEPLVGAPGTTFTVTVRPALPSGQDLGPGHRVQVALEPGGAVMDATDTGSGAYVARVTPAFRGAGVLSVRIEGAELRAHPRILVR